MTVTVPSSLVYRLAKIECQLEKVNTCHTSSGPKGGQFCATSGGKVGGHFQAGSKMAKIYGVLDDGQIKSKAKLSQLGYDAASLTGGIKHLHKVGEKSGAWKVIETSTTIQLKLKKSASSATQVKVKESSKEKDRELPKYTPSGSLKVRSQGAKWAKRLPSDERQAIRQYTGSAYHVVNKALRTSRGKQMVPPAKAVEAALSKAKLPEDVVVFRGVSSKETFRPGKTFIDHGFLSASMNIGVAHNFTGSAGSILRIKVRAGTEAAFVKSVSLHKSENELIMNRGATLRVIGKSWQIYGGEKVSVIDLDSL